MPLISVQLDFIPRARSLIQFPGFVNIRSCRFTFRLRSYLGTDVSKDTVPKDPISIHDDALLFLPSICSIWLGMNLIKLMLMERSWRSCCYFLVERIKKPPFVLFTASDFDRCGSFRRPPPPPVSLPVPTCQRMRVFLAWEK